MLTHHAPTRHDVSTFPDTPITDGTMPCPFVFCVIHFVCCVLLGFATSLEAMLKPPIACWLFGHTHYSSAQKFEFRRSRFKPLDLGSAPTRAAKLKKKLNPAKEVLVCSNQLGYSHHGEAKTSRFNPFMTLSVQNFEGGRVSLAPSVGPLQG